MPSRRHMPANGTNISCQIRTSLDFELGAVYGLARPSSCLLFSTTTSSNRGSKHQTLRFFGGRQPLCGIGVTSLMDRTSMPAVDSARTADSRPAPGPLTRTSTVRRPASLALLAAVSDACCAANGVPLRDPRNPSEPELDHDEHVPHRDR